MKISWTETEQPWWCKLRRADRHIQELAGQIAKFLHTQPFGLDVEPGSAPTEVGYRFSTLMEIPADLSCIVGDAVHNLCSALDHVAYALARNYRGGEWSRSDERKTSFPITRNSSDFAEFMRKKRTLFGAREERALRSVQPFAIREEGAKHGVRSHTTDEQMFTLDDLNRVNRVWNIDKHRRLSALQWFLPETFWTGDSVALQYVPVIEAKSSALIAGQLVGYFRSTDGTRPDASLVHHEVGLKLHDDLLPHSAIDVLGAWHRKICGWVIPRMAVTLETGTAPMMIDGGWLRLGTWQES